jgi:hypothetical protein
MILLENSHTELWRVAYLTSIRFDLAGQHFDESGFTGTIGTDDAVTIPWREFKTYVLEEHTLSKAEFKFADVYQGFILIVTLVYVA